MKLLYAALALAVMGCVDEATTGGGQGEGMASEKLMAPNGEVETPAHIQVAPERIARPMFRLTRKFNSVDESIPDISTGGCKQCTVQRAQFGDILELTVWLDQFQICKAVVEGDAVIYNDCD